MILLYGTDVAVRQSVLVIDYAQKIESKGDGYQVGEVYKRP